MWPRVGCVICQIGDLVKAVKVVPLVMFFQMMREEWWCSGAMVEAEPKKRFRIENNFCG